MSTSGPPLPSSRPPVPSSFDDEPDFYEESRWQKLKRRIIEEPLIPLGCALTCAALFGATRSIRSGDKDRTNMMFRRRIYAQGFTLVAMLAGSVYWQKDREKRKEFDDVIAHQQKAEKHEAWLKELDVRDAEDREVQARISRARERRLEREMAIRSKEGQSAQQDPLIKFPEEKKSVVESVKDKAADLVGKGGESKSALESSEARGVLDAVRGLSWRR